MTRNTVIHKDKGNDTDKGTDKGRDMDKENKKQHAREHAREHDSDTLQQDANTNAARFVKKCVL